MPQAMAQFHTSGLLLSRQFWISIAFAVCVPCSFLHKISSFKWTSALADVSVAFFAVILLLYTTSSADFPPCESGVDCTGAVSPVVLSVDTIKVFSVFSMAFNCQLVNHL
jgi:amino acid permease